MGRKTRNNDTPKVSFKSFTFVHSKKEKSLKKFKIKSTIDKDEDSKAISEKSSLKEDSNYGSMRGSKISSEKELLTVTQDLYNNRFRKYSNIQKSDYRKTLQYPLKSPSIRKNKIFRIKHILNRSKKSRLFSPNTRSTFKHPLLNPEVKINPRHRR
mmetsp:Transcript_22739/g.20219  ORF Transcript_22739/g.20219 Transcript_22739/m.20219 type:complete len:156 (+) Transcript_22739:723-1190(+)